jgi:hypothetical protein
MPSAREQGKPLACAICGRLAGLEATIVKGTCKGGCRSTQTELEELMKLPRNKLRRARKLLALNSAIEGAKKKEVPVAGEIAANSDLD